MPHPGSLRRPEQSRARAAIGASRVGVIGRGGEFGREALRCCF
jgi:hypothetical protein